jgi:dTDP-4-amino-4,6-dideoxygalactose transaminase
LAALYRRQLPAGLQPVPERDAGHVYHLFPIRAPARDALAAHLATAGVGTLVHYPVPLSGQRAFAAYEPDECPVAARAAAELLSLPLHPRLEAGDVSRVSREVTMYSKGRTQA